MPNFEFNFPKAKLDSKVESVANAISNKKLDFGLIAPPLPNSNISQGIAKFSDSNAILSDEFSQNNPLGKALNILGGTALGIGELGNFVASAPENIIKNNPNINRISSPEEQYLIDNQNNLSVQERKILAKNVRDKLTATNIAQEEPLQGGISPLIGNALNNPVTRPATQFADQLGDFVVGEIAPFYNTTGSQELHESVGKAFDSGEGVLDTTQKLGKAVLSEPVQLVEEFFKSLGTMKALAESGVKGATYVIALYNQAQNDITEEFTSKHQRLPNPSESENIGYLSAVNVLTDKVSSKILLGESKPLQDLAKKLTSEGSRLAPVGKLAKVPGVRPAGGFLEKGISESIQESIQESTEILGANNQKFSDLTTEEAKKRLATAGALGAGTGSVGGTARTPINVAGAVTKEVAKKAITTKNAKALLKGIVKSGEITGKIGLASAKGLLKGAKVTKDFITKDGKKAALDAQIAELKTKLEKSKDTVVKAGTELKDSIKGTQTSTGDAELDNLKKTIQHISDLGEGVSTVSQEKLDQLEKIIQVSDSMIKARESKKITPSNRADFIEQVDILKRSAELIRSALNPETGTPELKKNLATAIAGIINPATTAKEFNENASKSLVMKNIDESDDIPADAIQDLIDSGEFTKAQINKLVTYAKLKKVSGSNEVTKQVFEGTRNKDSKFIGINTYRKQYEKAINDKNIKQAKEVLGNLKTFTQKMVGKSQVFNIIKSYNQGRYGKVNPKDFLKHINTLNDGLKGTTNNSDPIEEVKFEDGKVKSFKWLGTTFDTAIGKSFDTLIKQSTDNAIAVNEANQILASRHASETGDESFRTELLKFGLNRQAPIQTDEVNPDARESQLEAQNGASTATPEQDIDLGNAPPPVEEESFLGSSDIDTGSFSNNTEGNFGEEGISSSEVTGETLLDEVKKRDPLVPVIGTKYELFPGAFANTQQEEAIDKMLEFYNDRHSKEFLLTGGGGTGKTTIVNQFVDKLLNDKKIKSNQISYTALSHKASAVLTSSLGAGKTAGTIHSFLGMKSPGKFEIDEDKMDGVKLLIIDEVSMADEAVVQALNNPKLGHIKKLYIGDPNQFAPVRDDNSNVEVKNKDSVIFEKGYDHSAELVVRVRQNTGSPITPIGDAFVSVLDEFHAEGAGAFLKEKAGKLLLKVSDRFNVFAPKKNAGVQFLGKGSDSALDQFISDFKENPESTRILTYNNERKFSIDTSVANLNRIVRKTIYGADSEEIDAYVENDALISYSTNKETDDVDVETGLLKVDGLGNSFEYKVTSKPTLVDSSKVTGVASAKNVGEFFDAYIAIQVAATDDKFKTNAKRTFAEIKEAIFSGENANLAGKPIKFYEVSMRNLISETETTSYLPSPQSTHPINELLGNISRIQQFIQRNANRNDRVSKAKAANLTPLVRLMEGNVPHVQFAYSINTHKSQGSSYRNVYVMEDNIVSNEQERTGSIPLKTLYNALYVAYTRATSKLVVINKGVGLHSDNVPVKQEDIDFTKQGKAVFDSAVFKQEVPKHTASKKVELKGKTSEEVDPRDDPNFKDKKTASTTTEIIPTSDDTHVIRDYDKLTLLDRNEEGIVALTNKKVKTKDGEVTYNLSDILVNQEEDFGKWGKVSNHLNIFKFKDRRPTFPAYTKKLANFFKPAKKTKPDFKIIKDDEGNEIAVEFIDNVASSKSLLSTVQNLFVELGKNPLQIFKDPSATQKELIKSLITFEKKFVATARRESTYTDKQGKTKKYSEFEKFMRPVINTSLGTNQFITPEESIRLDPVQLLFKKLNVGGVESGYMDRNILSAMATTSMNWLTTQGKTTLSATKETVNRARGADTKDSPTSDQYNIFGYAGVPRTTLALELGKAILREVGITAVDSSDSNFDNKMATNLGQYALYILGKQKLVVETAIPAFAFDRPTSEPYTIYVRMSSPDLVQVAAQTKKGQKYTFNTTTAEFKQRASVENGGILELPATSNKLEHIFKTEKDSRNKSDTMSNVIGSLTDKPSSPVFPRFKDDSDKQFPAPKFFKNGNSLPVGIQKSVQYANNVPFRFKKAFINLLETHSRNKLIELFKINLGYEYSIEDKPLEHRKSYEGANLGILTEIENLFTFYDMVKERGLDSEFFFKYMAITNSRIMIQGSGFNYQANKLQRHSIFNSDWLSTFKKGDNSHAEIRYKLAVMQGLGQNLEKKVNAIKSAKIQKDGTVKLNYDPAVINQMFDEFMSDKGVEELVNKLTNKDSTMSDFAKIGKFTNNEEKSHSLDTLLELVDYFKAKTGGKVTTSISQENDAVTSGVIIGLIQAGVLTESTKAKLEAGGVFFTEGENLSTWSSKPGNLDNYGQVIGAAANDITELSSLAEYMNEALRNGDSKGFKAIKVDLTNMVKRIYTELKGENFEFNNDLVKPFEFMTTYNNFVPEFKDLTGKITREAREIAKSPTMTTNYGAAIAKAVDTIITALVTDIESKLAEEVGGEDSPTQSIINKIIKEHNIGNNRPVKTLETGFNIKQTKLPEDVRKMMHTHLSKSYGITVQSSLKKYLEDTKVFKEMMNSNINLISHMFNWRYLKFINESKGIPTVKQMRDFLESKEYRAFLPIIEFYDSNSNLDEGRVEGLFASKTKKVVNTENDPAYTAIAFFNTVPGGTATSQIHKQIFTEPGVATLVGGTQGMDSAFITRVFGSKPVMSMFDAVQAGSNLIEAATADYLQNFVKVNSEYSIAQEVSNTLDRSVKNALKLSAADKASLRKYLTDFPKEVISKQDADPYNESVSAPEQARLDIKEAIEEAGSGNAGLDKFLKNRNKAVKHYASETRKGTLEILNQATSIQHFADPLFILSGDDIKGSIAQQAKPTQRVNREGQPIDSAGNVISPEDLVNDITAEFGSTPGQIDIDESLPKVALNAGTLTQTYDEIKAKDNISETAEHDAYLRVFLEEYAAKLMPSVGNFTLQLDELGNKTKGRIAGDNIYVALTQGTSTNPIAMSGRETYAHEVGHAISRAGLLSSTKSNIVHKIARLRDKSIEHLSKVFGEGNEHFIFLNLDPNNQPIYVDQLVEEKTAKDRFDYVFRNKKTQAIQLMDLNTGTIKTEQVPISLHEFVAYGLTNKHLIKHLASFRPNLLKDSKKQSFAATLQHYFNIAVNALLLRFNRGHTGDVVLLNLVKDLNKIQKTHMSTQFLINGLNAGNKVISKVATKLIGEPLANFSLKVHKNKYVNTASLVAGVVNPITTSAYLNAFNNMAAKMGVSRRKFLAATIKEVIGFGDKEEIPIVEHLARSMSVIDKTRDTVRHVVSNDLKDSMLTENVSDNTWEALTQGLIRNDASALFRKHYNLKDLRDLIDDPSKVGDEIKDTLIQLRKLGSKDLYNLYRKQSNSLAHLNVFGKANWYNTMLNPTSIAILPHTIPQLGITAPKNMDLAIELINKLTSLYGIQLTNPTVNKQVVDLIDSEVAINPKQNGFTFLVDMHNAFKKESLTKNFDNKIAHTHKGYAAKLNDPFVDTRVVDEVDVEQLLKEGYVIESSLPENKIRVNSKPKVLMVNKDYALNTRVKTITSLTSEVSMGQSMLQEGNANDVATFLKNINDFNKTKMKTIREMKRTLNSNTTIQDNIMVPTIDDKGHISDYRNTISNSVEKRLFKRDDRAFNVLGHMYSHMEDKANTKGFNRETIDILKADFDKNYLKLPQSYVTINKDSTDPELAEIYRLMPEDMRRYATSVFGDGGIVVRDAWVDIFFAYRKFSVVDKPRNKIQSMLKKAETIWQEIVKFAKTTIVVRLPQVIMNNIFSNTIVGIINGVPPEIMAKLQIEGIRHLDRWLNIERQLVSDAKKLQLAGITTIQRKDIEARIVSNKELQRLNPIKPLIDKGLFPTIVEDIDTTEDFHSNKSKFIRWADPVLNKLPQLGKEATNQLYMGANTSTFKLALKLTQYSDFIARFAIYEHLVKNQKQPANQVVSHLREDFINYALPTHKYIQYANDMGLAPFTRYPLRIFKVLARMTTEKSASVFLLHMLEAMLGLDISTPFDSNIVTEPTAPFQNPFGLGETAAVPAVVQVLT